MTVTVPVDTMSGFARRILSRCGLPETSASLGAEVVVYADERGFTTHGASALASIYAPRLLSSQIDPAAVPAVLMDNSATAVLDGRRGLGLLTATTGMDMAIQKAGKNGIGMVAVRNSTHFGPAGYYTHRAAQNGLIGLAMTNCGDQGVVPPLGGRVRMLGTNPISVAVPAGNCAPFVLDMSTTTVATGKIRAAREENRPVPQGWLAYTDGSTATDPDAYFNGSANVTWLGGTLVTGGAKGYGLALMVELLCGPLAGASHGPSPRRLTEGTQGEDTDVGHVLIAVAPAAFGAEARLSRGTREILETVSACPPAIAGGTVTYPGEIEAARAREARRSGIALPERVARDLTCLAEQLDLTVPSELLTETVAS